MILNLSAGAKPSEFGAVTSVAPEDADTAIQEATGGHGVDLALEIFGTNSGFQACWNAARVGGTIVLLGAVFPSPPISLTLEHLVRRNLTVRGVHNYAPRHLALAVEFIQANHRKYPFDSLVSTWLPLSRAKEAFQCAEAATAVRVGIVNE